MLSAAYSGIFQATGLLDTARAGIARMSRRITPFGALLCTAVAASMIACNQTLSILLTHQLCTDVPAAAPSPDLKTAPNVVQLMHSVRNSGRRAYHGADGASDRCV